ncbi:MAG TPA: NAD(P)/FAD-dependent oxidoreductase [Streptosporangiaceae bacterium]|jgi:3-(3-hydroxy-phenyl)propionate hydroxylase
MATRISADRPVIIVGAGPVGMTAAAALVDAGVPAVVVEATPEPRPDWRASTFHAATMELLEDIGITERMLAEGLAVPRYQYRDRRDGLVAEFDLSLLAAETRYPFRLQLNQQHLVRFLYDRLIGDPRCELRFGTRFESVDATADGVRALVRAPDGPRVLTGSYLIGADGASSTVRKALDVDFEGVTYAERFLIVSTPVDMRDQLPGIAEVNYVADPHEWLFILHTPESWRVLWPVPPDVGADDALAPEVIQEHLQGVAPRAEGYPIVDRQLYSVHQRVAATFRRGRVLLTGDAAHVNSPVGGVGLNSGIHDAIDLVRRLVRIDAGQGGEDAELDTFADRRRRVAVEYVQADTDRNTQRMKETDPERREESRRELRELAADPDRARAWLRRVSLLESVQRFGVGAPPDHHDSQEAAS